VAASWREGEGPKRRHPIARRAPTRTSVSAWWWSPGPRVVGAVAVALVEAMREREREKREKERTDSGTIPTYVRRADTSADEHK
jgi:hypothetical protein